MVLQQVTGQPNILYYAEDLFQAVGFCGDVLSAMAAIGDEASFPFPSQNSQWKPSTYVISSRSLILPDGKNIFVRPFQLALKNVRFV